MHKMPVEQIMQKLERREPLTAAVLVLAARAPATLLRTARRVRQTVVLVVLVAQATRLAVSVAAGAALVTLEAAVPRNLERRVRAALEGS